MPPDFHRFGAQTLVNRSRFFLDLRLLTIYQCNAKKTGEENIYLSVPLKRHAMNKPGTPYNDPNTCITKYGRICGTIIHK